MLDASAIAGFLAASALTLLWGRALWYFDERSNLLRGWVFQAMTYTRWQQEATRALLLSGIYYGLGLLLAIGYIVAFRLPLSTLIPLQVPSVPLFTLILLGIAGEISLANLLVGLGRAAMRSRPEQFAELRDIPWMKGLRALPPVVVPVAAAFGGAVEEVVFRGVVLRILTERLAAPPLLAVGVAGLLFCLQQLIQVRTPFQAMVIGSGCVAISLVGGLLVVLSGSMIPAVLCHASFVLFFMPGGTASTTGTGRAFPEAAR